MENVVIAIEGVSGAGKTTLLRGLESLPRNIAFEFSPEYVELAGGIQNVPNPPASSTRERIQTIDYFLGLEEQRFNKHLCTRNTHTVIVLDRSIYTLLAHGYAEERMFHYDCTQASWEFMKKAEKICRPELIILLEASELVLRERYRDGRPESLFTDASYNAHFYDFFQKKLPQLEHTPHAKPSLLYFDSQINGLALRNKVEASIQTYLGTRWKR